MKLMQNDLINLSSAFETLKIVNDKTTYSRNITKS